MKTSLEKYRDYGRRIEDLIRPATFPLAVKIVRSEDEIAPEYKRPFRDLGVQNFVCQNFKMARAYGWTIAVTGADINCKLARALYRWDTLTDHEVMFAWPGASFMITRRSCWGSPEKNGQAVSGIVRARHRVFSYRAMRREAE